MKPHLPKQNQQNNSSSLHTNSVSSNCQSDEQQAQYSSFQNEQLQNTLKTLKKLKRIKKNFKLTELKNEDTRINKIFKQMSQFFNYRKKKNQKIKQEHLKQKLLRREARKNVGIKTKQKLLQLQAQNKLKQKGLQLNFSPQKINQLQQQFVQYNQYQFNSFCYVCKVLFSEVHHFYDRLCTKCADFNFDKRSIHANLKGFTALVTGARIKIGYQIALRLLRDQAIVFVTSRFFNDIFLRYQKEQDFQIWKHRLHIIQCDFTSSSQVENLIQVIFKKCVKLDILINNAAQTIVRPKQFYLQEIKNSRIKIDYIPPHILQLKNPQLQDNISLQQQYPSLFLPDSNPLQLNYLKQSKQDQIQQLARSSQNSQIDNQNRDQFDQPTDKRPKNSWVQKIDQISLIDCYTTQLINSIVPFHLISRLKPLMKKSSLDSPPKSFIINVSSMQGVFYRSFKKANHPHTNMAKAALNMITRTSGDQFAQDNIYMNSVDTGWVTQENPYNFIQKHGNRVPLDCLDGAMRVIDPIYQAINHNQLVWGKFIKDYHESSW